MRTFAAGMMVLTLVSVALAAEPKVADDKTVEAFRAAVGQKAEQARTMTVVGAEGWLFPANELRHVSVGPFWGDAAAKVSKASRPDRADPLPAIVAYHEACKAAGIELILLPVPAKCVVYPDRIVDVVKPDANGRVPRLDTAHQAFYQLLRDKGVTVLDVTDDLIAARADGKGEAYCRTDAHWSPRAGQIAAARVADLLKQRDWYKTLKPEGYATKGRDFEIRGDLIATLPEGVEIKPETLSARFVGLDRGGELVPLTEDPNSPVLVLADSHGLVFHEGGDMHVKGAGLADQLAAELGFPMALEAARGSAATPVRISLYRRGARDPQFLAGKKAIVWCFTVRELTESTGWMNVPLKKGE